MKNIKCIFILAILSVPFLVMGCSLISEVVDDVAEIAFGEDSNSSGSTQKPQQRYFPVTDDKLNDPDNWRCYTCPRCKGGGCYYECYQQNIQSGGGYAPCENLNFASGWCYPGTARTGICPICGGKGKVCEKKQTSQQATTNTSNGCKYETCPMCGGSGGYCRSGSKDCTKFSSDFLKCSKCNGSGKIKICGNGKTSTPKKQVITVTKNANIRSGPGTNYSILGTLKPGVNVNLINEKGEWVEIEYSSGKRGWIHSSLVAYY